MIQTGGSVAFPSVGIGNFSNAVGTTTVIGAGSTLTAQQITLGYTPTAAVGTGMLRIYDGGAVTSSGGTFLGSAASSIVISGGTLTTGGIGSNAAGTIDITDPPAGAAITLTGGGIYAGVITGSGSIVKSGSSTQTLGGINNYTGRTTVNGGTLILASGSSISYTANSTGTLNLGFGNFGFSSLVANPGGTIQYNDPVIFGGFLHGGGVHDIHNITSFNGTTFGPGVSLTLISQTLNNVSNSGALSTGDVTWNGGYNTAAGSISLLGTLSVSGFENTGAITVPGRTSLVNSGGNLVSGGGGRIRVDSQGSILLGSTSLDLYGSLLVNNGLISGTTNVGYGALVKGGGTFGAVNVTDGGRFSPGNSPGSVTTGSVSWSAGGNYTVEISDALAGPGIGWDLWNVVGDLLTTPATDPSGRFTISLTSLAANAPGFAANFDPNHGYHWRILSPTNSLQQIDLSTLSLDTTGFANDTHGGHFALSSDDAGLYINFSSVPEPSLACLLAITPVLLSHRKKARF